MKPVLKKIFGTRGRLRSTSVPRSLGAAFSRERNFKESFQRAHSYASYLNDLPVFNSTDSPKMSRSQGNMPPWKQTNSLDIRKIPIKAKEHDLYKTFLWFVKPDTVDQIVKVPLGLHDAEYDHTENDSQCGQTRWDVYNIPSRNTLGILWRIELEKDTPIRVLVTPEAFNIIRAEYMVLKPQYLRKLPTHWDQLAKFQEEQQNEEFFMEDEVDEQQNREPGEPYDEEEEVDRPGAQCMEVEQDNRREKSLAEELDERESSEESSDSRETEDKETSSTEEEQDQIRLKELEGTKMEMRQQIQTRLMAKKNKVDPELRDLQKKAAQIDCEAKLIKAKAEVSRNQRKLRGEVKKNVNLQKELQEERTKVAKLNGETRSLTEERKRNDRLQKENESVIEEFQQISDQLQEREAQLATEKKVNSANKTLMQKKEEHIMELQQEMEETQEQLDQTRQELDRTIRRTEKAIQEKDDEMEARNLQKEAGEDRTDELRSQLQQALAKTTDSRVSNTNQMKKKLDSVTKQLDEARVQCGQLEETLNNSQVVVEEYRTKITTHNREVEDLSRALNETKEESEQLKTSKTRLQHMLTTEKTLRNITKERLEEEAETINQLTGEIQDLKDNMERLMEKYRENKAETRIRGEKIKKLNDDKQRINNIRNKLCMKMDSLQDYLFRRDIRIPPVIHGVYTTDGEDSDEGYSHDWREDDVGHGQERRRRQEERNAVCRTGRYTEERQNIPVRITDERRTEYNVNHYDGNHEEEIDSWESQQENRTPATCTVPERPERTRSAPGSRRNSLIQEEDEPRSRTRPGSPINQTQNQGISIIVKPGHPGGNDQVIQVIPQGANAEQQGAYGGLEQAIEAGFSSGITKITSAMATRMDKNQIQEDLIFRGTPGTISLKDWLSRLQQEWEPDWDDAKKLKLAIRHLDRKNAKLLAIANHQHTDYQTFQDRLQMVFGSVIKPFYFSKWQLARRFRGNRFRDWMCSHLAIELVDKTTNPWNQGELTDNEMVMVMENLAQMIPKKVLAEYRSLEGSWNCQSLRTVPFSQLLNKIVQDEATWENIWNEFDNSHNIPAPSQETRASYRMNSVQYSSGRRQPQTWRPQRNEGFRQRTGNNLTTRGTQHQNQSPSQARPLNMGYRQQTQQREPNRNRNVDGSGFNSGRGDQRQSRQFQRRRDPPFSGNSFRVTNYRNRDRSTYNGYRQNQNREVQRTPQSQRNDWRDRRREPYQTYRNREERSRNGYQRPENRRINTMDQENTQFPQGESGDVRQDQSVEDRTSTQHQMGISQALPGNYRTPTSNARDVGDAPRNSGYRN